MRRREFLDEFVAETHTIVEILHADTLVFPVFAMVVDIKKHARDAKSWDAGNARVLAVGGPGTHCGDKRNARPNDAQNLLHGLSHLRQKRRRRDRNDRHYFSVRSALWNNADCDFRIVCHALECFANFFGVFARKNAAIDVGARGLWESVWRMTAGKHRGDACG